MPAAPETITRGLFESVEVRAIDEESRTATFVASTEGGVRTWEGIEHLRIKGMRLERFRKNPVVIDAHNRREAGFVIGRAKIHVKGRELIAVVTFAETDRANDIWILVRDGFLRAVSVGFIPEKIVTLEEGDTDGRGESAIHGPAIVIKQSELFELSLVPVPADEDALRRSFFLEQIVEDYMAKKKSKKTETPAQAEEPTDRAADPAPEVTPEPQPEEIQGAALEAVMSPAPTPTDRELLAREIRAVCPTAIRNVGERAIVDGVSFEEYQARAKVAWEKLHGPIGTPDAPEPQEEENRSEAPKAPEKDHLVRSLCAPSYESL